MSASIIKLGLLSLVSVALAAPVAPSDGLTGYGSGDARPSYGSWGKGKGRGKGRGRPSGTVSAIPTNYNVAAGAGSAGEETVYVTSTNFKTVYASASPAAVADVSEKYAMPAANPAPAASPAAEQGYTAPAAGYTAPAASNASPVASPASSAPAYSGGSSGAKGGVAFETANQVTPFVGKSNIGWCYNWNANPPSGLSSGITYIPTLWGLDNAHLDSWVSAANTAIGNGADAVVGFNEPDHKEQANLDYNTAATNYKKYITDNFSGKAKLVSPSVTNGAAPMGLSYLSNFMGACSDCGIQAINIHWYDSSSNIDYFKTYIQGAYDQFKLPIWLTEFGTTDGNDDAFLAEVLPWLDSQTYVEKYAYFMAKEGVLLSGGGLSAAGNTYASAA